MEEQPTVSTEAQRQALDAMSAELVRKLNTMIAEQEQRVRDFAAAHPNTPLPPVAAPAAIKEPEETAAQETHVAPPPAERVAPRPVPVPPIPAAPQRRSVTPPAPPEDEAPEAKRIGFVPVAVLLVFLFCIIRSCS